MPKKEKSTDPMSLLAAWELAKVYAVIGLDVYNKIAEQIPANIAAGSPAPASARFAVIPAAMIMSFAAELLLKCIGFQRTGAYPENSHDLQKLVDGLPEAARHQLRETFEKCSTNGNLLKFKFEWHEGDAPPHVPSNEGPSPNLTFEEAVALASPLFVKLRYLHEDVAVGFSSEIDFRALVYLVEACGHTLQNFEGSSTVKWN